MPRHQNVTVAAQQQKPMHRLALTEAQIVRMDDAQYMSDEQKQFFRGRLTALQDVLQARSRESAAEIAIVSAAADPVDRASDEEEHRLAIASRMRDADQLIEVRVALARIDADEFGWCDETGEMIGVGRLLICPTTMLCVEAQQRRESKTSRYRI
jgi:DnaK suppressor protein